ncbi:unnamed protein product [Brugia timori]|uniref:Uncharacterized protein n=1 Tax=Brugia timori TaxID=42155 RepID=A0A3P7WHI2_9BILA|nr:unnamed protein product [Brugia timori]
MIREIRRELNIAPEEKTYHPYTAEILVPIITELHYTLFCYPKASDCNKDVVEISQVYGYYLTRPLNVEGKSDDDGYSDKPADKLDINAESINETVEKLNLSTAITIVADIAGIVQVKNDTALNDTGI